jgi:(p)ppGpp synthase/HD superfamily hydrolase
MSTLERAIALAAQAHAGQVDKGGAPYILHPLRVMLAQTSVAAMIVGVLHDVVEDTALSLQHLRDEGFTDGVVSGVDAVSRREGETYREFVLRAAAHPLGRPVKLADLADNSDLARFEEPTERDRSRAIHYRKFIALIHALPPFEATEILLP